MADHTGERRNLERETTMRKGSIVSEEGAFAVDCVVKNITEAGAKLKLDPATRPPARFTLKFANGNQRPCEVTWAETGALGVRFLDLSV